MSENDYILWHNHRIDDNIDTKFVYKDPSRGDIVSRVGGVISIYFFDGWQKQIRLAIRDLIDDYIKFFGTEITHYHKKGAKRLQKFDREKTPKYFYKEAEKKEDEEFYFALHHVDLNNEDDPGLWQFMAYGFSKNDTDRKLSGLKIHTPASFLLKKPDDFVDLMVKWAGRVHCVHGSGGLGVLTKPGLETGWKSFYYPLMIKYPSLEYDAMGDYWSEVRHGGYDLPKSSNWLTFLGDANILRLGGEDVVRSQITAEMSLKRYEGGYLLRAGERPVIDANGMGGVPQSYKDAARIIKPILFEGYEYGIIEVPPEKDSLDETLKWIHRFEN